MAVNKVVYGETVLVDLCSDTVTEDGLLSGATAHAADGKQITGALTVQNYYTGTSEPDATLGKDGDLYFVTAKSLAAFTVTSNQTTYDGALSNITDGDTSTYWWCYHTQAIGQASGSYIQFAFSLEIILSSFDYKTLANTGDCIIEGTALQTSLDGETWTDVGTFSGNAEQTFNGINVKCRYVRLYWVSESSKWLCISEITINYTNSSLYTGLKVRTNGEWADVTAIYEKAGSVWAK